MLESISMDTMRLLIIAQPVAILLVILMTAFLMSKKNKYVKARLEKELEDIKSRFGRTVEQQEHEAASLTEKVDDFVPRMTDAVNIVDKNAKVISLLQRTVVEQQKKTEIELGDIQQQINFSAKENDKDIIEIQTQLDSQERELKKVSAESRDIVNSSTVSITKKIADLQDHLANEMRQSKKHTEETVKKIAEELSNMRDVARKHTERITTKLELVDKYLEKTFQQDLRGSMKTFDTMAASILSQMKDDMNRGMRNIEKIEVTVEKKRHLDDRIFDDLKKLRSEAHSSYLDKNIIQSKETAI